MAFLFVLIVSFFFKHTLMCSEDNSLSQKKTAHAPLYTLNGHPFNKIVGAESPESTYCIRLGPPTSSSTLFIEAQSGDLRCVFKEAGNPCYSNYEYTGSYRKEKKEEFIKTLQFKREFFPELSDIEEDLFLSQQEAEDKFNNQFSLFGNDGLDVARKTSTHTFSLTTLLFKNSMTFSAPDNSPAFLRQITFYKLPGCINPMIWGRLDFTVCWPNLISANNFHYFSVIGVSMELVFEFPTPSINTLPLVREEEYEAYEKEDGIEESLDQPLFKKED